MPLKPNRYPLDALLFRLLGGVLWLHLAFNPLPDIRRCFLDVLFERFEVSDHISLRKFK